MCAKRGRTGVSRQGCLNHVMTQRTGGKNLVSSSCSLMDKNMAMLNLGVQNKEGWSLKLCKSPLNVKLLTFKASSGLTYL